MMDENKEVVRQYIENVLNTGNTEDLSEFISPHYTEVIKKKRYRLGLKGIQRKIAGIREIYPDLKISIDLQITEGDWVVTSYIMNGTQRGSWMKVRPTGKPLEIRGVNIDRVVDGKIMEHGSNMDLLDPLIEINQHAHSSIHWIEDNIQNNFIATDESATNVCESGAALQ